MSLKAKVLTSSLLVGAMIEAVGAAPVATRPWAPDSQAVASILTCNSQAAWARFVEQPNPGLATALAQGHIRPARFFGDNHTGQFEFTRPSTALGLKIKGFSVSFGAIPGPAVFVDEPVELIRKTLTDHGIELTCGPQANPGSEGCESGEVKNIDSTSPTPSKMLAIVVMRDRAKIPSGETAVICAAIDKPAP